MRSRRIRTLRALAAGLCSAVCGGALGQDTAPSFEREFAILREPLGWLCGGTGRGEPALRHLALARFAASSAICAEIDACEPGAQERFVARLYSCLAFVKDPAIIPWLETNVSGPEGDTVARGWVKAWQRWWRATDETDLRWVESPERWSALFQRLFQRESDKEVRLDILNLMCWYFHDEGTARLFHALENQEGIPPFELLVMQRYLILHEQAVNTARLQATITNLTSSAGGRLRLLQYAARLRHELFVPWLISVYDDYHLNLGHQRPQGVLCQLTFARGISDRQGWQEWYDKHRHEARSQWVAQALSEVDAALATSPDQARAILRAAKCHWAVPERAAIPYLKSWVDHKPLHPEIIPILFGVCHPAWWQELLPVGRRIRKESHMYLFFARSARAQIQTLNFDGSDSTWERRVTRIFGDEEDYQYRVKQAGGGVR